MKKSFCYVPAAKSSVSKNPIILDERFAFGAFWSLVTIVLGLIVVAIYWLLAQPVA